MPQFYPLYLRRSDGVLNLRDGRNEPTLEQLDQKPNAQGISDFYRHSPPGDAKEMDWRRKLGGMLIREVGGKESNNERNFILAALPENYRVYEHLKVRRSEQDNTETKFAKTHAAGGNDRQDAYLYGHPQGRKKRYRSPAEFFPHLLWLAVDESGDPDNCTCKFCSPEELDKGEKAAPKPAATQANQATRPIEPANKAATTKPLTAQTTAQTSNLTWRPSYQRPGQSLPSYSNPAPLPRFKTMEQKKDQSAGKLMYRAGEVVWFCRGQDAWGLGAVVKCDASTSQYRIQPLSHPFNQPPIQTCSPELLRPWLAWSPPPCTSATLNTSPQNGNRIFTYDSVDWASFLRGAYGSDADAEVDASILATKAVETTFTPFDPQTPSNASATSTETHYNGIFIGAEKIWIGDPVRLRSGTLLTDIMVLHDIVEQPNPHDPSRPRIILAGQSYSFRTNPPVPGSKDAGSSANNDLHLPARMREELRFRNGITRALQSRLESTWQLSNPAARLDIADIKGRWYESNIVMPLLDPAGFRAKCASGDVPHAGLFMNNQGACNGRAIGKDSRPADIKKVRREEAFGLSVPKGFKISRGLDEPKATAGAGDVKRQAMQQAKAQAQNQAQKGQTRQQGVKDVKMEDAKPPPIQPTPSQGQAQGRSSSQQQLQPQPQRQSKPQHQVPNQQQQPPQAQQNPKQQPQTQAQHQHQHQPQPQPERQPSQQQKQQQQYPQQQIFKNSPSHSPYPQNPYQYPPPSQQQQSSHPQQYQQPSTPQQTQQNQQQTYMQQYQHQQQQPQQQYQEPTMPNLDASAFEQYMKLQNDGGGGRGGGGGAEGFFGFGNDYSSQS